MSGPSSWEWPDPEKQRKLVTIEDYIFWSYAALTVSRQITETSRAGIPSSYAKSRTRATNTIMTMYQDRRKSIRSLDRDDALAQDSMPICAHFGCASPKYHWDHLIPRNRLNGEVVSYNQVRSCPHCNTSRGNLELMQWHRQKKTFPSLSILRRYLKICYFYSIHHGCLTQPVEEAMTLGLPFDPRNLPRKLPPVKDLVWDYAYPDYGHEAQ